MDEHKKEKSRYIIPMYKFIIMNMIIMYIKCTNNINLKQNLSSLKLCVSGILYQQQERN